MINRAEKEVTREIPILREAGSLLEQALKSIETSPSDYLIPSARSQHKDNRERIRRNYFFVFPAIQNMIRWQLEMITSIKGLQGEIEVKRGNSRSSNQEFESLSTTLNV